MKMKNNAKNGVLIIIALAVIALIMLLIVNIIPNVDINKLSEAEKLEYKIGAYKGETPLWKIICYIIVGILIVIATIVDFIMCRCHYCGKHINCMNIFTKYCPYCSKSLDTTK